MKRLLYIFAIIIAAVSLQGCEREVLQNGGTEVPEGYMPLNIAFAAPVMSEVSTKAVDPDGKGINNITLFCFDAYGIFINYVTLSGEELDKSSSGITLTGVIKEPYVPENTRRIHFVANQNMGKFDVNDFRGKSEYDVAATLEGSSGMMIYWGYFAADGDTVNDSEDFQEALKKAHGVVKDGEIWVPYKYTENDVQKSTKPIRMLRNQARFQVPSNANFTVSGFTVVNTNAFGTVAPYHPEKGFSFSMATTGTDENEKWADCDWTKDDFITLPHNTTRLSPPEDVDKADETFVFETDNNSAHPVSIIIKGKNKGTGDELYYRVILMDGDNYIKVRRNFSYTINITGDLHYGQTSFGAALTAPATNNLWLSINDDVKEITDETYSLSVRETNIIVLAENTGSEQKPVWELSKPATGKEFDISGNWIDLGYNITKNNGSAVSESDKPDASWAEGNNISKSPIENSFGEREISVHLDNLDGLLTSPKVEGTVVLKKGVLQRKIKITVLKKMSFVPVWVSTQVNMDANSNVNLLFTVPESCPDELLPFKVYVSVNHLDIRNTSGRTFPVITEYTDPYNYGADTYSKYEDGAGVGAPIGYKYVYTVTQKGDQRMYFSNTVQRSAELRNLTEWVTIESPYFETTKKAFTFNTSGDFRIEMPGLSIYTPTLSAGGESTAGNIDVFSPDEQIKYMLVPQKKNAPVTLDLAFTHWYDDDSNPATPKIDQDTTVLEHDEFLFYSENLMHKYGHGNDQSCNCTFALVDAAQWGTGGTLHAFKFDDVSNRNTISFDGKERKIYEILALTKKAKSEEVVRISSNPGPTYKFGDENDDRRSYRSIIFELANYRPFRFAAEVTYKNNTYGTGSIKDNNTLSRDAIEQLEVTDSIEMTYEPGNNVDLLIDITSFKGSDGKSVDPFGTAFDIYIVAPMLGLGTLPSGDNGKLSVVDADKGIFKYSVAALRADEQESAFTYGTTKNVDQSTEDPNQSNERKKLPFKKKSIVADGEILITTDPVEAGVTSVEGYENTEQIVNFYSKKFKITSQKITGVIKKQDGENPQTNLEADAFVSFALTRNNSRIGSMRIYHDQENGVSEYELTLRPEYNFNWNDDNPGDGVDDIIVSHTHTVEDTYEVFTANIKSLADLFINSDITLIKQQ